MATLTTVDLAGADVEGREPTAVELAERRLTDAVASGDARQIERAQRSLERARAAAERDEARARDRAAAEQRANAERLDRERAERRARADEVEAQLRERTPEVVFPVGRGRRLVVKMSAQGIEAGWSAEACRRIAWHVARRFADRVVASRNLGRVVDEVDWVDPLLTSEAELYLHVRRGIVRVEGEPTDRSGTDITENGAVERREET